MRRIVVSAVIVGVTGLAAITALGEFALAVPKASSLGNSTTGEPFVKNVTFSIDGGRDFAGNDLPIPAGKRLIIESFSAFVLIPCGQLPRVRVVVRQIPRELVHAQFAIPLISQGPEGRFCNFSGTEAGRIYAENAVGLSASRSESGSDQAFVHVGISGTLVDLG